MQCAQWQWRARARASQTGQRDWESAAMGPPVTAHCVFCGFLAENREQILCVIGLPNITDPNKWQ